MDQDYWHLGRWARVPVYMHWTVLITFAWLYLFFWDLLATAIAVVACFALFLAHEFGHVFMLRRRKIPVESITLYGFHGKTAYGYAEPDSEIWIAWGGAFAQLVVLILAWAVSLFIPWSAIPAAAFVLGPVLFVFAKLNIFLMVIALLPIGPFDGRAAWAAIPRLRRGVRRWWRTRKTVKLSPEKLAEIEQSSEKAAAELMRKLTNKSKTRNEDT